MRRVKALTVGLLLGWLVVPGQAPAAPRVKDKPEPLPKEVAAARARGLGWLTRNQAADGSWGKTHTIAVTSFACLAYLSAADEPYTGDRGKALVKGLRFLMKNHKGGVFLQQGHTWIHGQGFGTLALSEAYGRSLLCKTNPDLDMKEVRAAVAGAVKAIAKSQSTSGGWWYTPGSPGQHEGSTTVCAVQAIVSAANYRIPVDEKVLERGFEYLKKSQAADGGFVYKLGDAVSMKEGTAAGVATLGLMQKFDFAVMIKGYQFLVKLTPAGISGERFPYYGHFYGSMGMHLLWQEYKADKTFREKTTGYIAAARKDLLSWQDRDGAFALRGWFADGKTEDLGYSTAFGTMALSVPEARLSIYSRTPPKLPRE